ncbi:MAG: patatin-like phospholipase family protein [Odoribacter sp.]|nr:patatin-like phospholipase family protein [Odoribacter sp.]
MEDKENLHGQVRLGIALSGGGARGFAHAGALAAVEEAGLKPDVIAGVSAGSIVAALYSAGVRPADFISIFSKRNFRDFVNLRPFGGAMFSTAPFQKFISHNLGKYRNLEELPIPVYLGATDFDHGLPVEFHTGNIAERVVASCSIPLVFKPVNIDGINYVDGGVLRNHPAWIIRDKCDVLIGVNVSPLNNHVKYDSFFSVAMRTYNLMAKANQLEDMQLCDINIEPMEIAHYRTFDLRYINNVYMSGYIHARKALRDAGLWKRHELPVQK